MNDGLRLAILKQANRILARDDWMEGVGWDVNAEALPDIADLLEERAKEIRALYDTLTCECGEWSFSEYGWHCPGCAPART